MISSELEELTEGSDRVVVLRDGRTVAELPHDGITQNAIMAAMAHGRDAQSDTPSGEDGRQPAPGEETGAHG